MTQFNSSNREHLQQGIDWIKADWPNLIQALTNGIAATLPHLPTTQHEIIATRNLTTLLQRLESNHFDGEQFKAYILEALKHGASLQTMTGGADVLFSVLTERAQQQLRPTQPLVYEALMSKAGYVTQLTKATMGAALIQYEGQKNVKSD